MFSKQVNGCRGNGFSSASVMNRRHKVCNGWYSGLVVHRADSLHCRVTDSKLLEHAESLITKQ